MLTPTNAKYKEVHRLFHNLWTKSVGTHDYVKKDWNRLDVLIFQTLRDLGMPGI